MEAVIITIDSNDSHWDICNKALILAVTAHFDQKRWGGEPYIQHILRVATSITDPIAKTVAYLHDLIEDTDLYIEDLALAGYPQIITEAIDAITHRKDTESYDIYIARLIHNHLACQVKQADLLDNMNIFTDPHFTDKRWKKSNFQRLQKYWHAYWKIQSTVKGYK